MGSLSLLTASLSWIVLLFTSFAAAAEWNYSTASEHCDIFYNYTIDPGLECRVKVTNVTLIPAHGDVPAYCRVAAMAEQYTGLLLFFPADGKDWKGIYSAEGCGGSCGTTIYMDEILGFGSGLTGEDVIKKGYVSSTTDMGHQNLPGDNMNTLTQFRNNRTVLINWSYLSTHYLAITGKAMAEYYYGVPAKHSFFRGGSTGGRQGMIIAQRYPHDFDAIITGFAAFNKTGIPCIQNGYLGQAMTYKNGTTILSATDLNTLAEGALTECDANDGLVDGIIDPSYKCDFDPLSIYCAVGKTPSGACLGNMDKVNAAKTMYAYAYDKYGRMPYRSRFYPGSELEWLPWAGPSGVAGAVSQNLAVCYQVSLPDNWTVANFDLAVNPYQMGYMGDIMTPQSYDLSIFSAKGGKIIHYQGMSDGLISMDWNLYYYQGMIEANGVYERTSSWYRFFYYPGMGHADRGTQSTVSWRADYYSYLEDWYVNDKAPESIMVERVLDSNNTSLGKRLYFPWPLVPKYIGGGKPNGTSEDLSNWIGVRVPRHLQQPGLETYPY